MEIPPVKRQKREMTTIEHLPDEIIHKILDSLDQNSLKSSAAVNKRFASIVASSSVLLKTFKLRLSDVWKSKQKFQEVLSLKRSLQCLEVVNVAGCHDALVKIFKRFGPHLRSLSLIDSKIDDFTLREILKSAESLESLFLSEVCIVKKLPAINPVSMRKLKSLTISHCDWNICKFVTAQVNSLDVKSYLDEGSKVDFVNFLAQQRRLKDFTLRGTSSRTLFQHDDVITNCRFDLEKFRLDHDFGKNSDNVNWRISGFLSLHLYTLKVVMINGPHCDHINGFVIANLNNLDALSIDVRGLPKDEAFYDILATEPNGTLKELTLRGFFTQHEAIKKILRKYPAVEKLELNDWGNGVVETGMVEFAARNFPNLLQLSITEISNGENIKFASLKNLSVTYIRNAGKLVQFILRNSSVDTLKVGLLYIGQVTTNFIGELRDLKNVKHLAFGGNLTAMKMVLEQMRKKDSPTGLTSLELSLIADGKMGASEGKSVKLYFPIAKTTKFDDI